jgi:hypothetical protein
LYCLIEGIWHCTRAVHTEPSHSGIAKPIAKGDLPNCFYSWQKRYVENFVITTYIQEKLCRKFPNILKYLNLNLAESGMIG